MIASVETEPFTAAFARFRREAGPGASWVEPIRDSAIARFADQGFPTTRDEDWRRTSVVPIARTKFSLPDERSAASPAAGLTPAELARLSFEPRGCGQLVFVNGRYAPSLSTVPALPAGAALCRLEEAMETLRELTEPHLGRLADPADGAFTALNTAFMRDGLFLYLPENAVVDAPIHLLHVARPDRHDGPAAMMAHPRTLIVAERGASARFVESYAGPAGAEARVYLTNAVTEIVLGEGAALDHCRLQRESDTAFHVAATHVKQAGASRYTSHAVSLGAALARHDLRVALAGEGAECALNGLYMTAGRQHADSHTTIDHVKPHCASRELYKGVLDGTSRGVFNGRIIVRPDARGTDSVQANRNLLLSEEALVDTKPELQILNNDVKCRHAAAIGQLDETALFYLRSRAIGLQAARSLLIHAFASDVIGRIEVEPLRDALEDLLLARLPGCPGLKEALA